MSGLFVESLMSSAKRFLAALFAGLLPWCICLSLTGVAPSAFAQLDDETIEASFRKITPEEEARLRAKLAEPAPNPTNRRALRDHYVAQYAAAIRLAESGASLKILREGVEQVPEDGPFKNNLAIAILKSSSGNQEEAFALLRQAIAISEKSNPEQALFSEKNLVRHELFNRYKTKEAEVAFKALLIKVEKLETQFEKSEKDAFRLMQLARARSYLHSDMQDVYERRGEFSKALESALESEKAVRDALKRFKGDRSSLTMRHLTSGLGDSLARKVEAYRLMAKYAEAERALSENLRAAKELEMPANYLAGIYINSGKTQWAQQRYVRALDQFKRADKVYEDLGYEPMSGPRRGDQLWQAIALTGMQKFDEAQQIMNRFDAWAGTDGQRISQVRYRNDRSDILYGLKRYEQAANLYVQNTKSNANAYGDTHFFTAQQRGMWGASLWRAGKPEQQAIAREQLTRAVQDYMLPANAEFLEPYGIRPMRRAWIFDTYLEAVSADPSLAMQALGAADWVRGGSVQEALNDAALRAAAGTPALAEVVRREQDAKNEIKALRSYLSGEAGQAQSILPVIAEQMRARIAVLEKLRDTLQAEIKAKFPDYDRLVRPEPVQARQLAAQLAPDEAVLVMMPGAEATYVWLIGQNEQNSGFMRVPQSSAQITAQVQALRKTLDFPETGPRIPAFNTQVAHSLYQQLIEPFAAQLQGKKHLIVAAGGSLAQLPMSVLLTQPTAAATSFNAQTPWLIRQAAVTQVPSLPAWIALRRAAGGVRRSAEPLLAWGDPVFSAEKLKEANAQFVNAADAPNTVRNLSFNRQEALSAEAGDIDALAVQGAQRANQQAVDYGRMLSQLPETRYELQAIANILKADPARDLILGSQATRQSVLQASGAGILAKKQVVAFATHGLKAGDVPGLLQPALAMSLNAESINSVFTPLLTLEDVLSLKMNADWVILSACNTASGDGKAEEALSGLARGFFYAGAKNLLVTHWAVNSIAAVHLTTQTLNHYASNPGQPKAESLRVAMLNVMQRPNFSHPTYWAAFALVGDGGR